MLVRKGEGYDIAKWLTANDIVGVVMGYRLPNHRPHIPLPDVQRALRTLRVHSSDDKIVVPANSRLLHKALPAHKVMA